VLHHPSLTNRHPTESWPGDSLCAVAEGFATVNKLEDNINMSRESSMEADTSPSIQNISENRVLAFGFHAPSVPRQMVATTLQEAAVEHELA
jgi:hypothetical protein